MTPPIDNPDVLIEASGSVAIVSPLSTAARDWMSQRILPGPFYPAAILQRRYAENVAERMRADGLSVMSLNNSPS